MDNIKKTEKLRQLVALVCTSRICSQTTVCISTSWRLEGQAAVRTAQLILPGEPGCIQTSGLDEIFLGAERICLFHSVLAVPCDTPGDWERSVTAGKKNCSKTLRSGKGKKLLGNLTVLRPANFTFVLKRLWDISSWNPFTDMRWARRYSEIANMDCLLQQCDCVEKERAMWAVHPHG